MNDPIRAEIKRRAIAEAETITGTFLRVRDLLGSLTPWNFARALQHNANECAPLLAQIHVWDRLVGGLEADRKLSDIRLDLQIQQATAEREKRRHDARARGLALDLIAAVEAELGAQA